jgi:hypothetical protein
MCDVTMGRFAFRQNPVAKVHYIKEYASLSMVIGISDCSDTHILRRTALVRQKGRSRPWKQNTCLFALMASTKTRTKFTPWLCERREVYAMVVTIAGGSLDYHHPCLTTCLERNTRNDHIIFVHTPSPRLVPARRVETVPPKSGPRQTNGFRSGFSLSDTPAQTRCRKDTADGLQEPTRAIRR